jgi:hypothetical protein
MQKDVQRLPQGLDATPARNSTAANRERMKSPALNRLNLALAAAAILAAAPAAAQSDALAQPGLLAKLRRPVTTTWRGQTLGAALQRLSETQDLPVWLDRRVDPSVEVDLAASGEAIEHVLSGLAALGEWRAVPFRSLVYFGPRQTADELATLSVRARDGLAKASPNMRTRWLKPAAWSYPRLSEPRRLLGDQVKSVGAALVGDDQVSHDLWPARSIRSLAPIDRVLLILADFDLTCDVSPTGQELRVVRIKRPVEITRRYTTRQQRNQQFEQILAALPPRSVRKRGGQLEVSARWEEHERLRGALRPASTPRDRATPRVDLQSQRFTLKIENQPLDRVLDQLASQLDLNVVWSKGAPTDSPLISCDVRQVDLDDLLEALLAPAGFVATRDGQTVTIRPAP